MAVTIHPTAIVESGAWLDDGVEVGPFCIIGSEAVVGKHTRFISNVVVRGSVRIGEGNVFHAYCVIGGEPQDHSYRGDPTWVVIGNHNTFREYCTVHRATVKECGVTTVGSHNFLMGGVHIGHDACVGNHITIANNTLLSGHVHIQDYVGISGLVGIHQFVTIGSYAFVGGLTRLTTDVPPFMLVDGNPSEVRCLNLVGLKRRGFEARDIRSLASAHRMLYRMHMSAVQAKEELKRAEQFCEPVAQLFAFLENQHAGRRGRGREGLRAA
jgi:UDP-N-acetylglucosamine acyltransferase